VEIEVKCKFPKAQNKQAAVEGDTKAIALKSSQLHIPHISKGTILSCPYNDSLKTGN
jgi:hypothetical protein